MTGSEKQIAWAEDIKAQAKKKIGHVTNYINNSGEIQEAGKSILINTLNGLMDSAKWWIDNRDNFSDHSDNWAMDYLNGSRSRRFIEEVIIPAVQE